MKKPAITSTFGTALFLVSALAASAVPVTYRVNMGIQMSLGNFNPGNGDAVIVAGTFSQNPDTTWTTTNVMTVSADTNIYELTFDDTTDPVGNFENHKFIIDVGGTGTTLNWETIDNRFFQVPATATNLPVVYFNNVSNVVSIVATQITFQVDMGVQIQLGNFDPTFDVVWVAGDAINNWAEGASVLSQSVADTNIYVGTFTMTNTVGATVNYKFIMNTFAAGVTWENDGVGPNGAKNRQFTFPATATTLPVVFFNNITNTASVVVEPITFSVNTAVQTALGNFDPYFDSISVAGNAINNWSPTTSYLTQTPTNLNLWVGTFDVTNAVGGTVSYKFTRTGGATWESIPDRQFVFTNAPTTLPTVFFNNVGTLGRVSVTNISGNLLTLAWPAGPGVRLQTTPDLTGAWSDVANTAGVGSITVTNDTATKFFRLIGP